MTPEQAAELVDALGECFNDLARQNLAAQHGLSVSEDTQREMVQNLDDLAAVFDRILGGGSQDEDS